MDILAISTINVFQNIFLEHNQTLKNKKNAKSLFTILSEQIISNKLLLVLI